MIVAVRAVVDPIIFVLLIQRCRLAESWQYYGYLWFDFLPLERYMRAVRVRECFLFTLLPSVVT